MSNKIRRLIRKLNSRENGYTLIEVLVALAILGFIGTALYITLGTSLITTGAVDERTTAQKLAESQMEYVKQMKLNLLEHPEYGENPPVGEDAYEPNAEIMAEYGSAYDVTIDAATAEQGERDELLESLGITIEEFEYNYAQLITVRVFHDGDGDGEKEQVLKLESYKFITDETYIFPV